MTTPTTRTPGRLIQGDAELGSVLVALGPIDDRKWNYLRLASREFDAEAMLDNGWSTGEYVLIQLAHILWTGNGDIDLGYLVTMLDGQFFRAAMDAIAVRRHEDVITAGADALDAALATGPQA